MKKQENKYDEYIEASEKAELDSKKRMFEKENNYIVEEEDYCPLLEILIAIEIVVGLFLGYYIWMLLK